MGLLCLNCYAFRFTHDAEILIEKYIANLMLMISNKELYGDYGENDEYLNT